MDEDLHPTHGRGMIDAALAASPLPQRHSLRDREALLLVVPPERGLEEEAVPLTASTQRPSAAMVEGGATWAACLLPASPSASCFGVRPPPVALPLGDEAAEVGMLLLWLVGLLPIR